MGKNTKVFDETKLFLEIDIDNHRYICLSSKFNFEKREKKYHLKIETHVIS